MIRTSQHILKYSNNCKINQLEKLYENYKSDLQLYINDILSKKLLFKALLSSKLLPTYNIFHSQWKQILYKQASEIVRSNIKYQQNKRYKRYKKCYFYFKKQNRQLKFLSKRFSELNLKPILSTIKIDIKNISINIDERLLTYQNDSLFFNEFIGLTLPYFRNKRRAYRINLPIKWHKQSLKYQNWKRRNTIQLKKINDNFYFKFFYEKESPDKIKEQNKIGFDIGYKKLLSDSNGNHYGKELYDIYQKISNKKQDSKKFKRTLIHRDNKINEIINKIDLKTVSHIFVEDLKNIKHKSELSNKINNKLQRWSYTKVLNKLSLVCNEKGLNLIKVNPMFTSQTCSRCGNIDKDSRNGETYQCKSCNLLIDADTNAAVNILRRGVYSPSNIEKLS